MTKTTPKQKTSNRISRGGLNYNSQTPLLPVGVNNKETMPKQVQNYDYFASETISIITVPPNTSTGTLLYNQRISPVSVPRLGYLSQAWQRIDWNTVHLHLVALNGSTITSGYTMGFTEDPNVEPPVNSSEVIGFLTALRGSTVRQAWVESTAGQTVNVRILPEMYTTLGSDERRYYIGRLMIAASGNITEGATFQLMMRYRVKLFVPKVPTIAPVPETGYVLDRVLKADGDVAGTNVPSISCASRIPAVGFYQLGEAHPQSYFTIIVNDDDTSQIKQTAISVRGFKVITSGGTARDWATDTQYLDKDLIAHPWPAQNGDDEFFKGAFLYTEGEPLQYVFPRGTTFVYSTTLE